MPCGQPAPFRAGDDARHDVEGDQPLFGLLLAVDGEGDAGLAEDAFGVRRRNLLWVRRYLLRPSYFCGVRASGSTLSRQRALMATISAPSGPFPREKDWMPQVLQKR
jgi:hypothetical protein